jgi:hypothetical protein
MIARPLLSPWITETFDVWSTDTPLGHDACAGCARCFNGAADALDGYPTSSDSTPKAEFRFDGHRRSSTAIHHPRDRHGGERNRVNRAANGRRRIQLQIHTIVYFGPRFKWGRRLAPMDTQPTSRSISEPACCAAGSPEEASEIGAKVRARPCTARSPAVGSTL